MKATFFRLAVITVGLIFAGTAHADSWQRLERELNSPQVLHPEWGIFIQALAYVESSNNPRAHNRREDAIGLYQIRPSYWRDAYGDTHPWSDAFDPTMAEGALIRYFTRYEPDALYSGDWYSLARLHNAGPRWQRYNNNTYALKVIRRMEHIKTNESSRIRNRDGNIRNQLPQRGSTGHVCGNRQQNRLNQH